MSFFTTRYALARNKLQRRLFLAALGTGIAAPLATKMSRLAGAEPAGRIPRLFVYYVPHGVPVEHWEVGTEFNLEKSGIGILGGFAPYKDQLLFLRGVENRVDDNHEAIRSTLSGLSGEPSVDWLIAQQLGLTPHVLGAHVAPLAPIEAQLFHHENWVTPIASPATAIDTVLGDSLDEKDDARFRQQALQLTEAQLESLRSEARSLCRDDSRLTGHLDAISELKARALSCNTDESLPIARSMAEKDEWAWNNFTDVVRGHLEVAAQGMVCGTARIVGMQNLFAHSHFMMNFPGGPGIANNYHSPIADGSTAELRLEYAQCQKWFVDQLIERLVATLAQPDPLDPSHTVLENSIILFTSEVNDGKNTVVPTP